MSCGTERIDRFVKEFYPRNDTVDATISALLPRDGNEDIFLDQHGDPVYLERSSILDGVSGSVAVSIVIIRLRPGRIWFWV